MRLSVSRSVPCTSVWVETSHLRWSTWLPLPLHLQGSRQFLHRPAPSWCGNRATGTGMATTGNGIPATTPRDRGLQPRGYPAIGCSRPMDAGLGSPVIGADSWGLTALHAPARHEPE